MSVTNAHWMWASAWAISCSQSLALRRARIVHESDRSITHLFGSRTKPLASLGRGTTLIVMPRAFWAQVLNSISPLCRR
jgi:hypothetical protein